MIFKHILSFTHYQTTNFRLFQTERVCRRQFQIWRKWQKVIQTGRKHCGKRRNCSLRAISPFPTVFSKGLFPRGIKRCHCVGMGKEISVMPCTKHHIILDSQNSLLSRNPLTLSKTSHFRLFQTQRVWRWQFLILLKLQGVVQKGRKHCGKGRNCSL